MPIFWKVRNNSDIKLSLEYLKVNKSYSEILLEDDSAFQKYLKTNPKYVCISYNNDWKIGECGFGWFEGDDNSIGYMMSINYIFVGCVNLRNQKLKKLNYENY